MGTSNFYNHENGIFVLRRYSCEEVLEMEIERMLDDTGWIQGVAQDEVFEEMRNGEWIKEEENNKKVQELMNNEAWLIEKAKEEITEEMIYEEMNFYEQIDCEELFEEGMGLNYQLELEGLELIKDRKDWNRARVYSKTGKLLAELSLESGYYDGVQIIVETDPYELLEHDYDLFYNDRIGDYQDKFVKSKLNEVYSEHNKTLFKVISNYTTPLIRVGGFSDGTSVYQLA